jgi:hypothetical protein
MSPSVSLDQMGNTVHASDEKSYNIRFNPMANNKNVQMGLIGSNSLCCSCLLWLQQQRKPQLRIG